MAEKKTANEVADNAPATDEAVNDTTAENADVVVEAPKNDTTEMVVYAVDSTAVRIGDKYFYSSDWTIPATLADQAEAMGLRKVEA